MTQKKYKSKSLFVTMRCKHLVGLHNNNRNTLGQCKIPYIHMFPVMTY